MMCRVRITFGRANGCYEGGARGATSHYLSRVTFRMECHRWAYIDHVELADPHHKDTAACNERQEEKT